MCWIQLYWLTAGWRFGIPDFSLSLFENKPTTNLEGVRAKSWFCLGQQQTFLSPSSLLVQDLS